MPPAPRAWQLSPPPAIHTLSRIWLPGLLILALSTIFASARPRPPMPPYPEQSLNSWRFDGTTWLTNIRTSPLIYDNLQLVESWSGHALHMTGPSGLLALPNNQPDGTTDLIPDHGTIRLWFAPAWTSQPDGTGPGTVSLLLEIGAWSATAAQGWWSLAVSPDGTLLGFLAQDANGQTTVLQTPIRWHSGEWRQVALSWSAQETVLFLDGLRTATGPGVSISPLTSFSGIRGFCVGSDVHGGQLAGGHFEEVFTFDHPCDDLEIAADYARTAPSAALGPITVGEETAMIAAAAGSPPMQSLGVLAMDGAEYDPNLYLRIGRPSQGFLPVTLNNTEAGERYQVWSTPELPAKSWTLEGSFLADSTTTEVSLNLPDSPTFFLRAVQENVNFEGITSYLQHYPFFIDPPDTMGAAGPDHFVELLNHRVAVYRKSGTPCGESTSELFFKVENPANPSDYYPHGLMYDPRILYDSAAGRWIASAIDAETTIGFRGFHGSGKVILAISKNSQPIGPDCSPNWESYWDKYLVDVDQPNAITDFDILGVDNNAIYITVYQVNIGTHTFAAIRKSDIFGAQGQPHFWIEDSSDLVVSAAGIFPPVNFDAPPNGYALFVAKAAPEHNPYFGGALKFRRLQWPQCGDPQWVGGWQEIADAAPPNSYRNYYDLDEGTVILPQKDGVSQVKLAPASSTGGSRLMTAVIRNGGLWTCQHVGLDGPNAEYDGGTVDRTAIQWIRLHVNATDYTLTYDSHGRIYDPSETDPFYYCYPSLMVDAQDLPLIGFSRSSASTFIGASYTWILSGSALPPRPLFSGVAFYLRARWGDYSYTCLDSDGTTFWTIQEYAIPPLEEDPSWAGWATGIARLQFLP